MRRVDLKPRRAVHVHLEVIRMHDQAVNELLDQNSPLSVRCFRPDAVQVELMQDLHARKCAQQTVQRGRMRARGRSQLVTRAACVGEQIGDAKRCSDMNRLRYLVALNHAANRGRRIRILVYHGSPLSVASVDHCGRTSAGTKPQFFS